MVKQHLMKHRPGSAQLLGISYSIYNTSKQRALDIFAQELAANAGDAPVYEQRMLDGGAIARGCVRETSDGVISHLLLWDEPEDINALMASWPLGAAVYRMNIPAGATPGKLPELSAGSLRGDASQDLRASCEALQTCFWREDELLAKLLHAIAESQNGGSRIVVIMDAPADDVSERARALMEILMRSLPYEASRALCYRTLCDGKRGMQPGVGFYSSAAEVDTAGAVVLHLPDNSITWPGEAYTPDADTLALARALGGLDFDTVDQLRGNAGTPEIHVSDPAEQDAPSIDVDYTISDTDEPFDTPDASPETVEAVQPEDATFPEIEAVEAAPESEPEPASESSSDADKPGSIWGMLNDAPPVFDKPAFIKSSVTPTVAPAAAEPIASDSPTDTGTSSAFDGADGQPHAAEANDAEAPVVAPGEGGFDVATLDKVQAALKASLTYANSDEFRRFTAEFLKQREALSDGVFVDYCARYSDCLHRFSHPMSSVYDSALADMTEEAYALPALRTGLHNAICGYPGARAGVRAELKKRNLPEFMAELDMPALKGDETPLEYVKLWVPAVEKVSGECPKEQKQDCLNLCVQQLCRTISAVPVGVSATSYILQIREAIDYLEHNSGLLLSDADFDSLIGRIIEQFDFDKMEVYDADVYDALQYAYSFVMEWELQRTDMQRAVCVWGRLINGAGSWNETVMDGVARMLSPMQVDSRTAFLSWVKRYFEGLCAGGLTRDSLSDSFTCFAVLSTMEFDASGKCYISGWTRRCSRMQMVGEPGLLDSLNNLIDTHKYIMGDALYQQIRKYSDPKDINDPQLVAELQRQYGSGAASDAQSETVSSHPGVADPASRTYDPNVPFSDTGRYPIVDEVRKALRDRPVADETDDGDAQQYDEQQYGDEQQYDDAQQYGNSPQYGDEPYDEDDDAPPIRNPFAALGAKFGFSKKKKAPAPAPIAEGYDSGEPLPDDEPLPPVEQYDAEGPYADDEEYDDSLQSDQYAPDAFDKVGAMISGKQDRPAKQKPRPKSGASSAKERLHADKSERRGAPVRARDVERGEDGSKSEQPNDEFDIIRASRNDDREEYSDYGDYGEAESDTKKHKSVKAQRRGETESDARSRKPSKSGRSPSVQQPSSSAKAKTHARPERVSDAQSAPLDADEYGAPVVESIDEERAGKWRSIMDANNDVGTAPVSDNAPVKRPRADGEAESQAEDSSETGYVGRRAQRTQAISQTVDAPVEAAEPDASDESQDVYLADENGQYEDMYPDEYDPDIYDDSPAVPVRSENGFADGDDYTDKKSTKRVPSKKSSTRARRDDHGFDDADDAEYSVGAKSVKPGKRVKANEYVYEPDDADSGYSDSDVDDDIDSLLGKNSRKRGKIVNAASGSRGQKRPISRKKMLLTIILCIGLALAFSALVYLAIKYLL